MDASDDLSLPDVDTEANEQTPLFVIMPSAGSTRNPSQSNVTDYVGLVNRDDEDNRSHASFEFEQSEDAVKPPPSRSAYAWSTFWRNNGRQKVCALLCLAVLLVLGLAWLVYDAAEPIIHKYYPYRPLGNADRRVPLWTLGPVTDLNVPPITRARTSDPSKIINPTLRNKPLPTNEWYQNLIMLPEGEAPSSAQNVFTVPYLLDVVGSIPGVHINPQAIGGNARVTNFIGNPLQGMVLGASDNIALSPPTSTKDLNLNMKYTVEDMSPLAVTLQWQIMPMTSSIVRGMPYATMHYPKASFTGGAAAVLPTIAAEVPLRGSSIAVDESHTISCGDTTPNTFTVQKEMKLTFSQSDFTWLAFFSEPVVVQCVTSPTFDGAKTLLQVLNMASSSSTAGSLTVRVGLVTTCTTGTNPIYCSGPVHPAKIQNKELVLRKHSDVYPGPKANFRYDVQNSANKATLIFDWDPRNVATMLSVNVTDVGTPPPSAGQGKSDEVVMYAMPHHMDSFGTTPSDYPHCTRTVFGVSCIVTGSTWYLNHTLPPVSFWADRPPSPDSLGVLAAAIKGDMNYTLPTYYLQGGGDTYFSGKMLAKLARILLIAEQVIGVCQNPPDQAYATACGAVTLPSPQEMQAGKDRLRRAVEIWLNGNAMTPFVYDPAWGGIVSCGCFFSGKRQTCTNRYPSCPAVTDPGLNFGNGFYNDHHFHYGYFIYSSAAVAHFDPGWGRRYYDRVGLLIRDIANPSTDDDFFPVTRNKDWYRGHSWAGGIPPPVFPMGRNQESSSEALNAYEGVSLFGQVMSRVFQNDGNMTMAANADQIRDVGKLLLVTELQSVDEYWHVRTNSNIYPASYSQNVVGILWSTMTEFQTWFGAAPYLPYGIQLLPITSISQQRDTPDWARQMYTPFANSCNADPSCKSNGWSILEMAILAEVGHPHNASTRAVNLPAEVFTTAGGNGHSLTNTLWYISTRPKVEPLVIKPPPPPITGAGGAAAGGLPVAKKSVKNCGIPNNCTSAVLGTVAGGFTCQARMDWLMNYKGDSETQACAVVAGIEFPNECGACAPRVPKSKSYGNMNCGLPKTCTAAIMNTDAGGYTCASRIQWLLDAGGKTEAEACYEVGTLQFPTPCGPCGPKHAPPQPKTEASNKMKLPGVIQCGNPKACTGSVLDSMAGPYTCIARISWLITVKQMNETAACSLVAGKQFPKECGACNPSA